MTLAGQIRGMPWRAAHEMHSPTMWNTKLKLSWNLFGPPPGIEPGSLRLAAIHSNHYITFRLNLGPGTCWDNMSLGQYVAGQNVSWDNMSQDKMSPNQCCIVGSVS